MGKKLIIFAIIGLVLGPILIVLGIGGAFLSLIADFVGLSLFGGEDAMGNTQMACIIVGIFMVPTGILVFIGSGILLIASIIQQIRTAFTKKPTRASADVEDAQDVGTIPKAKKGKGRSKKGSKGKKSRSGSKGKGKSGEQVHPSGKDKSSKKSKKGYKGKKSRSGSKGKKDKGRSKGKKHGASDMHRSLERNRSKKKEPDDDAEDEFSELDKFWNDKDN